LAVAVLQIIKFDLGVERVSTVSCRRISSLQRVQLRCLLLATKGTAAWTVLQLAGSSAKARVLTEHGMRVDDICGFADPLLLHHYDSGATQHDKGPGLQGNPYRCQPLHIHQHLSQCYNTPADLMRTVLQEPSASLQR
jgi:hypothetical protein